MGDSSKKMGAWVGRHVSDPNAMQFLGLIYQIIELWDDLIDKDKPIADAEINQIFFSALVTLPGNAFYRNNHAILSSAVTGAIIAWHTANALRAAKNAACDAQAYCLRKEFINLVVLTVTISSGTAAGQAASIDGWHESALDDPYDQFINEGNG